MVGKAGLFFKVYQRIFYDNCEKEFTLSRAWYVGQVLFSIRLLVSYVIFNLCSCAILARVEFSRYSST